MLENDSILRNLPKNLDRKQILFLDGIRHAVELMNFSYVRLETTLSALADEGGGESAEGIFTTPFLDAWAIVDSIYRLGGLLKLMPGLNFEPLDEGRIGFFERMQPIRKLRNVSDHLAERMDYVIAKNGTALGVLSWFTPAKNKKNTIRSCVILPGSLRSHSPVYEQPVGIPNGNKSDQITLAAGEYSANLTDAVIDVNKKISQIEEALKRAFENNKSNSETLGLDILISLEIVISNEKSSS